MCAPGVRAEGGRTCSQTAILDLMSIGEDKTCLLVPFPGGDNRNGAVCVWGGRRCGPRRFCIWATNPVASSERGSQTCTPCCSRAHLSASRAASLIPSQPCPLGVPCPAHTRSSVTPAKPKIHVNGVRDSDEPLKVTAKAGEQVTLECEAQGSPPPLVTWTKDARPVSRDR